MRASHGVILFFALLMAGTSVADPGYQTCALLDVHKNVVTTPTEWLWDTVVSSYDTVSYDLRVRVGAQILTGEYIPDIQPNGPLPSEWQPGRQLNVRIEKGKMFIKLSYDGEIETHIIKRERQK